MALQQKSRQLNFACNLGTDTLFLDAFDGTEEMGRLYRYELRLISDNPGLQANQLVGTPVQWAIQLPDESKRFWSGFVQQMSLGDVDADGRRSYRLTVVPWFWFLTQTNDCRIFQDKTVPEIIDEVLKDFGGAQYQTNFSLSHRKLEYCVQYRESDFNFLSRLMEQEGITYYFKHTSGGHEMVLVDHVGGYYDLPESTVDLPWDKGRIAIEDHLTSWKRRYQFLPGKYAQQDYNFKTPSTNLLAKSDTIVKLPGNSNLEIYDYPGEYIDKGEGNQDTKVRIEERETSYEAVIAASLCKTFQVGGRFKVGQHQDPSERGKQVVITTIEHHAQESLRYESGDNDIDFDYRNEIQCQPHDRVFRTSRSTPKPTISGIQTAIISGPPGEEIYPDEYGRVKVQFHWDRYGKRDENSSCWMRVSQVHAGAGFGGIDLPRIGEEVIVSFLEGDPDRPMITGRVFHAQNMPPFKLPDEKTRSGLKSKTYKGGGFNELSLDDTPGKEQIRIHGQYNMDTVIENDETHKIGNNRTKDIGVDEVMTIGNNQKLTVGVNKTVDVGTNHDETIGANQTIKVGSNQVSSIGSNQSTTVSASQKNSVGSTKTETVGMMSNEMVGFMKTTNVGVVYSILSGAAMNTAVGFVSAEEVGLVKKIIVGSKLEIVVGASKLVMESGGKVTIEGTEFLFSSSGNVKINGSIIDLN